MENELFMNAGVSHAPVMTTSPSSSSAMLNWVSTLPIDPSLSRNLSRDCLFWEKSTEQSVFDSALSSLVSSPTPSTSNFSGGGGENFIIRELIGKLGNIGDIYGTPASNGNVSGSCYATPMSSPPPRHMMTVAKPPTPLVEFSGDSGFAERAARFSCFGSRSFNGRTNSPFPINNAPVATNEKLPRISSTPALKPLASQVPAGESSGEISRKRKTKSKQNSPSTASPTKEVEAEKEDSDRKRSKKTEENEDKTKSVDPYKDYIHVRARRGQATDSHSLAERVRREKISERMKLLQDLVPGCNKVTGKALMLDEIINYVQSLQRQVEFLSMKLSSVNTRLDFNMDAFMSKDIFPSSNNNVMHQQQVVLQLDSSAETLLGDHHITNLNPRVSSNNNLSETSETRTFISHLPTTLAHFTDSTSQYSTFSEDDLHSIIHMGFAAQNRISESNQGPSNQVPSNTKAEL
ncbi:hypothetical protein CARUB_v10013649mg [Capsella rubella]|uniref:BHLH domain-containing protein n=1 Tax=Capsella rubella TaxID=81985 RepID=R0G587_9BRAS|nr:transcription factor bHLH62 [Capsella rubella]EOA30526.1 hypothetical protein CARUB_v10013649mg [Capsella rubella]